MATAPRDTASTTPASTTIEQSNPPSTITTDTQRASTPSATNPTTTTTAAAAVATLSLTVEFTGGLEILFANKSKHTIRLPSSSSSSTHTTRPTNVHDLIHHLLKNLLSDPRKEMFVVDGSVRPGILVLINDADWELEGEGEYELKDGDNILFVSTLHGG